MMKSVFVLWQDSAETRMWFPVAKLTQKSELDYVFNYTKGSEHKHFTYFPSMEDKNKKYVSDKLFTFFKNRLIPESRPEHDSMFEWSGLSPDSKNYLELLAISGGEKKTDHFRIVNIPTKINNTYTVKFFVSSINYLSSIEKQSLKLIEIGDELNYQFDEFNDIDNDATILLKDHKSKVGYLPHYLCSELKKLLNFIDYEEIKFKVIKVNHDAPAQYRILCEMYAPWPKGFEPFSEDEFSLL
ncbi:HIRAN domain-containing protein [Acinetobacter schindleri]|uniref:HIRAN domain-containing protein n=1 Tax=Acinetobacter schindleri TaxID=108981 RepID=UPI0032B5A8B7